MPLKAAPVLCYAEATPTTGKAIGEHTVCNGCAVRSMHPGPAVQELVCAADADKEAVLAYRAALEQALDQPAAAHPVESYGVDNMSLAQVGNSHAQLLPIRFPENFLEILTCRGLYVWLPGGGLVYKGPAVHYLAFCDS